MKNILLLLLLFTGIVNGQIINFPDANFKAKLLASTSENQIAKDLAGNYFKIDFDNDGEIQLNEALNVSTLNLAFSNISDITGIEFFSSLTKLEIYNNQLTTFDVASLVNLNYLDCRVNQLTSLNVNTLINLTHLDCYANDITALNVSSLVNLSHFNCGSNQISTINLASLVNLEFLAAQDLQITTLDVSTLLNLKYLYLDGNYSIIVDFSNLVNLRELFVQGCNLSSLDVSTLVNLTKLNCYNNDLLSLNVSPLQELVDLNCDANNISSLDVSNLTNLRKITCKSNNMTALNLNGCINLEKLVCANNELTNINLGGFTNLKILECNSNQLLQMNIEGCNALLHLDCSLNQISTIDLTTLTSLQVFRGSSNLVTILDFSNCPLKGHYAWDGEAPLYNIGFGSMPNLEVLILKNGTYPSLSGQPTGMSFSNLPSLRYVCIDDNITEINQVLSNMPENVSVNSYCSFTPGGDYNTIEGTIKFDNTNNGCDEADYSNPYLKINIDDGTNSGTSFTNNSGNYSLYTQTGNFTITPELEISTYFFVSPENAIINFPLLDNSTQTQNFCITANGVHPDLEVVLTPLRAARPGFDVEYKLVFKNKGNQTQSGTINLTFDDSRADFVSATPTINSQTGNNLLWNFSNLQPFETRVINLTLNINSPLDSPPVNEGDILDFTAIINPIANDETSLDNEFNISQTVVNAYDPNDKTCLEGNTITPEYIGKYVHYNINFENIGTADAVNVVIKDIIDTTMFDMNSLQLLYASHPVETKIDGNKVEFIFKNINLPPSIIDPIGGHGNVLFKIKTLPTLLVGDQIANIANIYFDYNAPIETNEARSTFATLNNSNFVKDQSITVAPNPAKNSVTVTAKNNIKSIQLYDVQGRILQTVLENNKSTTLDISNKTNGVYFLKITTEVGSSVEKIIKE